MAFSFRGAAADECGCEQLNFEAAEVLNKEGLKRFVQERATIADLNDRLVKLIELVRKTRSSLQTTAPRLRSSLPFLLFDICSQARCYEEENKHLECQIAEEKSPELKPSSVAFAVEKPRYSLDAVVERLRRQKVEFCCVLFSLPSRSGCSDQFATIRLCQRRMRFSTTPRS